MKNTIIKYVMAIVLLTLPFSSFASNKKMTIKMQNAYQESFPYYVDFLSDLYVSYDVDANKLYKLVCKADQDSGVARVLIEFQKGRVGQKIGGINSGTQTTFTINNIKPTSTYWDEYNETSGRIEIAISTDDDDASGECVLTEMGVA